MGQDNEHKLAEAKADPAGGSADRGRGLVPLGTGNDLGDRGKSAARTRRNSGLTEDVIAKEAIDILEVDLRRLKFEGNAAKTFIAQLKAEFGDDDQLVADMIEGSTDLHELLSAAALRVTELEASQDGIKAAVAKLRQRNARFERQIAALRSGMHAAMSAAAVRKLELAAVTLSIAATPRRLKVVDEAQVPDEFWRRELDKPKLADALKGGAHVPGAQLDNGGDTIRIIPS